MKTQHRRLLKISGPLHAIKVASLPTVPCHGRGHVPWEDHSRVSSVATHSPSRLATCSRHSNGGLRPLTKTSPPTGPQDILTAEQEVFRLLRVEPPSVGDISTIIVVVPWFLTAVGAGPGPVRVDPVVCIRKGRRRGPFGEIVGNTERGLLLAMSRRLHIPSRA